MNFKELTLLDLDACFEPAEWAEEIIYTPSGGDPRTIPAIWDETYEAVDPDTGATVMSRQPKAMVKTSDLAGVTASGSDRVSRGGELFRVVEYQDGGQGSAEIYLHRVDE